MPLIKVRHVTTYSYRQPVAFGEHRMMLRPRDSRDQRLLETRLDDHPGAGRAALGPRRFRQLRRDRPVFRPRHGAAFRKPDPARPFGGQRVDFQIEEYAARYPFTYGADEMPDLSRLIERQYLDPEHELDGWARQFLRHDGRSDTTELLAAMTRAICRDLTYIAREESGIQDPAKTLRAGSGSCRDFAVLMIEAARSLGLAARFVSGYLYVPQSRRDSRVGGGATHAWLEIYLPGAGWLEFDPTNGIVGNHDLVRVAVVRDPRQAAPISGTWTGFPSDHLGMNVEVEVTAEGEPAALSEAPSEDQRSHASG